MLVFHFTEGLQRQAAVSAMCLFSSRRALRAIVMVVSGARVFKPRVEDGLLEFKPF